MRSRALCVLVLLLSPEATWPVAPSRAEVRMRPELERLSQEWNRAWLKKDTNTVEALMAAEYAYVAPNGQVLDRASILAIIRSPTFRLERGTRTEVTISALGQDTAIMTDRWQGSGSYDGKPFTDDHRCSFVCVHRDGRWLVAWEHCSAIAR
jgi:uncharacterized protein (TIGR02246 family)